MSEQILYNPPRRRGRPPSRVPAFKSIGYTLDISLRLLVRAAMGRGPLAYQQELINSYWRRIFRAGHCRLTVSGREHLEPNRPYVVMSNHSSLLDIPALFGAFPGPLRMVTKEELMRVPLWGSAMRKAGFIPIDRRNREKAIAQLEGAKRTLQRGISVWIAPEGSRSRTGELGLFKKGGFHVALALGLPVVPTWIAGTREVLAPDAFLVHYDGSVRVCFGAPIATAAWDPNDVEGLMDDVRTALLTLRSRC